MRTTGGLHVFGDGPTAAIGEGTSTAKDDSTEMVETLSEGMRRGCAVSMVRGRAGMSRVSEPMVDLFLRRGRVSNEGDEAVNGAVMERARAISTGTVEVIVSGSVEDWLLR